MSTEIEAVAEATPMKHCLDCGEIKPLEKFPNRKRSSDGKYSYCRACSSARMSRWRARNPDRRKATNRRATLRKYGLTVEEYEELLRFQNGRCAVCGTDEPGHTADRLFDVDHDHETLKVRGLLCQHCNMGIGQFGDDAARLRKAAAYLEAHSG